MLRWVATIAALVIAAGVGFVAGYVGRESQTVTPQRPQQGFETRESEMRTLTREKAALEERLQQVLKEQERLAQENELLHKQQTTTQILGATGGALPELPPK